MSKRKCGERSSAIVDSRVYSDETKSNTRSSAAAYGSAASGRASSVWYRNGAEHAARKIDVGQRPLEDDRRPVERRRRRSRPGRFPARRAQPPGQPHQLFLTVAGQERQAAVRIVGRRHEHGRRRLRQIDDRPSLDFVEVGQPVVNALVETRRQQLAGGDHVDRLEPGKSREQIEIGLPQAGHVANPVARGDDDPPQRLDGRLLDELRPEQVLVDGARCGRPRLVAAVRRGQESGLPQQPLRTAVVLVPGELLAQHPLEGLHRFLPPAELIVPDPAWRR